MGFDITALNEWARELEEVGRALEALNGEIATVKFNPHDPASIEAAVAKLEEAINDKIASYRGNEMVESLAAELKEKYRNEIMQRAAAAVSEESGTVSQSTIDPSLFRQIENAVTDLRGADYNTYERHIKKLSRLLHSPELENVTRKLTEGIDLDAWLKAGLATQGGMVGSAKLEWPQSPEQELGTTLLLIDRFADKPDEALNVAHTFYYDGTPSISGNLGNMTRHVIVPFARDFIDHVKKQTGTLEATLLTPRSGPAARKVFVVHGHDEGAREAVARFLEKLDFEIIILHEQASQGRTVIEKIEAHGDVGFAVVLLTPDDHGALIGEELKPRSRQNVLLELGYFIGRLGRSRVCALKRGEVEVPSDFAGMVYTSFDDHGAWKAALGRELDEAGFEIDWNRVMRP